MLGKIGIAKYKTGMRAWRLILLALVLGLAVGACSKGTYAVEIFPEQHYQQSFKKQEPPRIDPPEGAVPVTGREVLLDFATADKTKNPVVLDDGVIKKGAELYRVNCSMCHGLGAKGDGTVGAVLAQEGYSHPPNLLSDATQGRTDGSIFWVLSNGVLVMPNFSLLLGEDDRWSLVHYLRFLAEQDQ